MTKTHKEMTGNAMNFCGCTDASPTYNSLDLEQSHVHKPFLCNYPCSFNR